MDRIYLVGFMGAGKTTIGRIVAERLGWSFMDLDGEIERLENRSVADIFRDSGEPYFRGVETECLRLTADAPARVVALGGGAYVRPENREFIESHGLSVYLHASLDSILDRIEDDGARPLFAGRRRVSDLYRKRLPLYKMARATIDTDGKDAEDVADRIVCLIRPS